MKAAIMLVALAAVCISASVYAVPPAYEGPFGNPEEPALRVIKWPWLGLRKLVVSTHEGLKSGMDKESLSATGVDGAAGAFEGTKTLVNHTAKGLVYAPLPAKEPLGKTDSYEQKAMAYIEKMTKPACEEQPDACATEEQKEESKAEKQEVKLLPPRIKESEVEKAQRRYIPEKAAYRDRTFDGGGNLLKLAR